MTGYCIGGLLAMHTAAAHPGWAVAAFHGPVNADGPDFFSKITADVHLGHAEGDMTPETLSELNQGLDAARVCYTSEIYPHHHRRLHHARHPRHPAVAHLCDV